MYIHALRPSFSMASLVAVTIVSRWKVLATLYSEKREIYLNQDDVCAGFGEASGYSLTDASSSAGDKGGVAFEGEGRSHVLTRLMK